MINEAVMNQRIRHDRLHHATLVVPVCQVIFATCVWPVISSHDLPVKFGYRQMTRGTPSYYAHCWFQLSSQALVAEMLGPQFVEAKAWGEQPIPPVSPVPWKWWDGGVLEVVVDETCPLTIHVSFYFPLEDANLLSMTRTKARCIWISGITSEYIIRREKPSS